MDLLRPPLPRISLRPDIPPSEFFDRCEVIAADSGFQIARREKFAGDGTDQLNVYVQGTPDKVMIRMVVMTAKKVTIDCDVVAQWTTVPIGCNEYLAVAKAAYRPLLTSYNARYGRRFRLGISKKPKPWDWASVDCAGLEYAHGKFTEAVRSMAVGPGDIRARLKWAFLTLHVVRPAELPLPLQDHLEWVFRQLTLRKPRFEGEGTLDATLARMKRATGARIAKRILAIMDALDELCPKKRE